MEYEEKVVKVEPIYNGKMIDVELMTVTLPNGNTATRDIVRHPGASVVVPVNDNREIYMVRQYRAPLGKISLELPAGKLDRGEEPETCAVRELKEETGLTAESLKHIISIHSTPGFSDEVLHMYIATGLKEGVSNSDDDEFISTEKIPMDMLTVMILNHEITDAKTIIGILLAHRIIKGEIII